MITPGLTLLLTLTFAASTPDRFAEASEVYHCGFEAANDINYDSWPDNWVRKSGKGYPQYLPIEIVPLLNSRPLPASQVTQYEAVEPAEGKQYLRIALDGGAASLSSPGIAVSTQFSYVLEARLRTKELKGHAATLSLTFVDDQGAVIDHFTTPPYQNFDDWTKIVLGPFEPRNDVTRRLIVGVHLEPGIQSDLFGELLVDDVWLGKLPRMSLASNSPHNIFTDKSQIAITCRVSGIKDREPQVVFELIDVHGNILASVEKKLEGEVIVPESASAAQFGTSDNLATSELERSFTGEGVWQPPIDANGFYRIRVTMSNASGVTHQRMLALAVIESEQVARGGEFGWSLPHGENPLPFGPLAEVLSLAGVNWIKYPVWREDEGPEWGSRFARFVEQMGIHDIRIVGLLDQPPASSRQAFGHENEDRLVAANIFHEAELWTPLVDPVMNRLALNIRWWQIGGDDDTSFVGYARLTGKMLEIKRHLERFGQEVYLGFGWRWQEALPQANPGEPAPWTFVSQTQAIDAYTGKLQPAFTGQELLLHLQEQPSPPGSRWIVLEPLSRQEYSTQARALDLVERMLAAKIARADAVFIPNPFDPDHGLMEPDGSPSEMLLPWRTTSLTLTGTQYAGNIQLPEGSHNRVFLGNQSAVMVVWNETPTTETLYLGESVKQIDLWGRVTTPEVILDDQGRKQQRIQVSRLPTFLTGLQPQIARWRMAFQFAQEALPSEFGRQLPIGYRFANTFSQGVGGRIRINTPDSWDVERNDVSFKLAPGEQRDDQFLASFGIDASSGPTPLRVDFELTADRVYQFSVFRSQQVGLGEVEIELSSHLDENGNLVVDQVFNNHTAELVSFNCTLFTPGRRRDRQPLIDMHQGQWKSVFILPNGEELIGKTMYLRAEEVNGARVLSYRFIAER